MFDVTRLERVHAAQRLAAARVCCARLNGAATHRPRTVSWLLDTGH
jgi:hypothetical protein